MMSMAYCEIYSTISVGLSRIIYVPGSTNVEFMLYSCGMFSERPILA